MNILFTCAGRRTYLLKYFKEQLGNNDKILGADMQLTAPALSVADIKLQVPAVYAIDYIDRVLEICVEYHVDLVISLNDLELPILSKATDRFKAIGTFPLVSSERVIDICFDKYKTAQFVENLGLYSPKTFVDYDKAVEAINNGELQFPLCLKPRWGSGSIGIEYVEDMEELHDVYALLKRKVMKSILGEASRQGEFIMIQEKLKGQEYGLDVMNDLDGNNVGVSVKKKLAMRAGETDKAETIDNETLRDMGERIGKNLKHIGNLDCDVFEYEGNYYVLELNPRFGGGFPFSYEAGVNFPKAIINWMEKKPFDTKELIPEYGRMFAKCDYLVDVK